MICSVDASTGATEEYNGIGIKVSIDVAWNSDRYHGYKMVETDLDVGVGVLVINVAVVER